MRIIFLLACFSLYLVGCAHIDYVGESYAPTTEVNVFYSEANVTRPYRVMGEVVATGDQLVSTAKIQEKMVEKARERGADAVVILGLERYESGQSTSYSESSTESKDKKGRVHVSTTGGSSTNVEEKKKVRAIFIKYKPAEDTATDGTR